MYVYHVHEYCSIFDYKSRHKMMYLLRSYALMEQLFRKNMFLCGSFKNMYVHYVDYTFKHEMMHLLRSCAATDFISITVVVADNHFTINIERLL